MDHPLDATPESILEEAQRLTHGARNQHYGPPHVDYGRTAALISALLGDKLREPMTAMEAALCMCCVKLSRQMHAPKRDNMVDLAGYAWVANNCLEHEESLQRTQEAGIEQDAQPWHPFKLMPAPIVPVVPGERPLHFSDTAEAARMALIEQALRDEPGETAGVIDD